MGTALPSRFVKWPRRMRRPRSCPGARRPAKRHRSTSSLARKLAAVVNRKVYAGCGDSHGDIDGTGGDTRQRSSPFDDDGGAGGNLTPDLARQESPSSRQVRRIDARSIREMR